MLYDSFSLVEMAYQKARAGEGGQELEGSGGTECREVRGHKGEAAESLVVAQ